MGSEQSRMKKLGKRGYTDTAKMRALKVLISED